MRNQELPGDEAGDQAFELVKYGHPGKEVEMLLDKERETVWTTQQAIANLFDRDSDTVGEYITNIFAAGEADQEATGKFPVVRLEGTRQVKHLLAHYNLDGVLSVGYCANSVSATEFRKWAIGILKAYLVEGYALNEVHLRDDPKSLRDLAADVRALRSGEKQIYEAVRDCFKLSSSDYESKLKHTKSFYAKLQDKFLVATAGMTASQIVLERARAEKDDMVLTHMRGSFPTCGAYKRRMGILPKPRQPKKLDKMG